MEIETFEARDAITALENCRLAAAEVSKREATLSNAKFNKSKLYLDFLSKLCKVPYKFKKLCYNYFEIDLSGVEILSHVSLEKVLVTYPGKNGVQASRMCNVCLN
jgi:hypothetical protein